MFYTVVNINFYSYLPQKLFLVIIISIILGLKLQKILQICINSFVNSHQSVVQPFEVHGTLKNKKKLAAP